jgi:hypothetical protein
MYGNDDIGAVRLNATAHGTFAHELQVGIGEQLKGARI